MTTKKAFDKHWSREYSLYYGVAVLYGLQSCIQEMLGKKVTVRGEGQTGWFTSLSEKGTRDPLFERFLERARDEAFVHQEIEAMYSIGGRFVNFAKRLTIPNDKAALLSLYQQFFDTYCTYCLNLWKSFYLAECASKLFEQFVMDSFPPDKVNAAIEDLSKPSKKAAVLLISDYFRDVKDVEKRIQFIQLNYPWLGSKDLFVRPITQEEIQEYAQSFVVSEKHSHNIHLDHPIVKFYQEMLYIKDKRDEYRREAFYYAFPLVKALAEHLHISTPDLGYLLPQELSLPDIQTIINKRKEGYIATLNDSLELMAGKEIVNQFTQAEEPSENDALQGRTGCPGIVRGKVQLIRTIDDIAHFRAGNVLVTVTTDPQHIVAMQKAIAFVTDEGGITCHAAIVAREMKKPCIVGTKFATRVLKDGELIEVDADNGIVKKIT